jgi:hypothetical protein
MAGAAGIRADIPMVAGPMRQLNALGAWSIFSFVQQHDRWMEEERHDK